MKLLFVDDNPNLIEIFKKWAFLKGFDAKFAYDGSEVIDLVGIENFDIILMDIDMPVLDGISTAEKLQKLMPQAKILILTGLPTKYNQNLPQNIVDILLKPISLSELNKKLSIIMNSLTDIN